MIKGLIFLKEIKSRSLRDNKIMALKLRNRTMKMA